MSDKKQESLRTPLGSARGLGSAKDGTHHWIMMRVTSILLLPLTVYFICQAKNYLPDSSDYNLLVARIGEPLPSIALILFIIAGFYHAALGVQTIIEDYVHSEGTKILLLLANKITFFAAGVTAVYAVVYITFALNFTLQGHSVTG